MNKIEEQVLKAVAKAKDKKAFGQIRNAIVPNICSRQTWYNYLGNTRQPSLSTANKILEVLKVWLPELTLEDLVKEEPEDKINSKIKLVKE